MKDLPDIFFGGGNMLTDNLLRILVDQKKYEVMIITLFPLSKKKDSIVEAYKELGVNEIQSLNYQEGKTSMGRMLIRKFTGKKIYDIFPTAVLAEKIEEILKSENINIVIGFHFTVLATLGKTGKDIKKVAILGDPDYEVQKYRINFLKKYKENWKDILAIWTKENDIRYQKKYIGEIIDNMDICGEVSEFHAKQMSLEYGKEIRYYKIPINKPPMSFCNKKLNDVPIIMLCGHMRAISTAYGIEFLANEIMPSLKSKLEKFEVHLLGRYYNTLPVEIRNEIEKYPEIKILGFVESIEDEYKKADLLLVPTPIELGIRTRIINAFSYGICVVAHKANTAGIPQLVDGINCLLGESGDEIAEKIKEVTQDQLLINSIRENGFETYKSHFDICKAGKILTGYIEELSRD